MSKEIIQVNHNMSKEMIQANQYGDLPYHHIPRLVSSKRGAKVTCYTCWDCGLEYMCYMMNIIEKIKRKGYKTVLDVGCGDGELLYLIGNEDIKKYGCDIDEHAILWAKAINPDATLICDDVGNITKKFECITLVEVLEHIPDELVPKFIQNIFDCLDEDGRIYLQVPTTVIPLESKHYRHYTLELLKNQLDASGVSYKIEKVSYIFKKNPIYNIYRRLFLQSKYWILRIGGVERFMWKYVNNKLKDVSEKEGRHLLVELKKD